MVLRRSGDLEPLEPPGALIGVFPDVGFEDLTVRLDPGDVVVFYTDGAIERGRGATDEADWPGSIRSCSGSTAGGVVDRLETALRVSSPLDDDVAVIVLGLTSVKE